MHGTRIRIVGVGGAGGRIVSRLNEVVYDVSSLVAINTDAQALDETHAAAKLQIGSNLTNGLGSGADANVGRQAAKEDEGMIRSLLAGTDLLIVVAGLGGGTGTGASPLIMEIGREEGAMVLCVATLPFEFEGRSRMAAAEAALEDLQMASDALLVIPNQRLAEYTARATVAETFEKVDGIVARGVGGIEKLLTQPGLIRLDFADLKNVLRHSGDRCTMGYGEAEGEHKGKRAIASMLTNPLLDKGKVVEKAGSVLLSIVGGPDMTLKEVGEITDAITAKADKECHVLIGTVVDEEWTNRVSLTAIVSEEWKEEEDAEPAAAPAESAGKKGGVQGNLKLESYGKGRFKDAEPTILDGEDLDIPTFVRRGIPLGK